MLAPAGGLGPSSSAAVEGATGALPAAAAALDPTLTVSTRDAYAALDKMFKVGAVWAGAGRWQELLEGWCSLLLLPPATLPDLFNAGVQGSLPLEHAGLPPTTAAGAALAPSASFSYPEPTMTINTKVAMDAINQMFKVSVVARRGVWGSGCFRTANKAPFSPPSPPTQAVCPCAASLLFPPPPLAAGLAVPGAPRLAAPHLGGACRRL